MGLEKDVQMRDWIEVGVFAPAKNGEIGTFIYLKKHYFKGNQQTITIRLSERPGIVGIDPNHLLIDWNTQDNFTHQ